MKPLYFNMYSSLGIGPLSNYNGQEILNILFNGVRVSHAVTNISSILNKIKNETNTH